MPPLLSSSNDASAASPASAAPAAPAMPAASSEADLEACRLATLPRRTPPSEKSVGATASAAQPEKSVEKSGGSAPSTTLVSLVSAGRPRCLR